MKPNASRRWILVTLIALLGTGLLSWRYFRPHWTVNGLAWTLPSIGRGGVKPRLVRPYGMAPAAFGGFVRACQRAHVHPWRISQTIGNHPRSVGYHHQDGTLIFHGQRMDYTAAVDLDTHDLTRPQIFKLVDELGRQGFAAFYREGPKWVNDEHIHAVYAPLRMKPQLRKQVREWERKHRRAGKPEYHWQKRWRRYWQA